MMRFPNIPCFVLLFLISGPLLAQEVDPREKRQIDFALGLYQRGDHTEAAVEFEVYLANPAWQSRREVALFFSAESYRQVKRSEKAEPAYRALLESHPNSTYRPLAAYRLSEIHLEKKEGRLARERLTALLEEELTPDLEESVLYALGLAASLEGESRKAIEWWKKGRAKFPEGRTDQQTSLGLGLEFFRIGEWESAKVELERWLASAEPEPSGAYVDALSKLAEVHEKSDRLEAAKESWLRVADTASDRGLVERALLSAARNAFRLEQWAALDELAPRLSEAVRDPASRFQANLLYGNRYYRDKNWSEAAHRYAAALSGMEDLPIENADERKSLREETLVRYGWCLFALKDWDLLQSTLQPLAESETTPAEALYLLAEAWKEKGNALEAIRWYDAVPDTADLARVSKRTAADLAFSIEDWRTASDLYLSLSEEAGDPAEKIGYRLRAADGLRKMERFARAAELYAKVRVDSSSPTVREKAAYLEGWSLQRGGEFEKAIGALEEFRKSHPDSEFLPEGLYLLGQAHEKNGDPNSAHQVLEALREKFPSNEWTAEGLLLLAAGYSRQGEYDKVLEALVEFQTRFPDRELNEAYSLWLARTLVDRGRHPEALITLEKLAVRNLGPEGREDLYYLLAESLRRTDRETEAAGAYEKYLAEYPQGRHLPAVHLGAGVCARRSGDLDRAREHSRSALELLESGATVDPAVEAQIYLLAGDFAFEAEDFDAAYRFYAKPSILVRHPVFTPIALARSAECKERLGDPDQARRLREEILRDFPESDPARAIRENAAEPPVAP